VFSNIVALGWVLFVVTDVQTFMISWIEKNAALLGELVIREDTFAPTAGNR